MERSCGTVLYTIKDGEIRYLLIQSPNRHDCGFPKGHIEFGESEKACALRETWEETSISARIVDGFRREVTYPLWNGKKKQVVYFLATYTEQTAAQNANFEKYQYFLLPFSEALAKLAHENTRQVLKAADAFLRAKM